MKWRILVKGNRTGTGIWIGDRKGKPCGTTLRSTHITAFFLLFFVVFFFFFFFFFIIFIDLVSSSSPSPPPSSSLVPLQLMDIGCCSLFIAIVTLMC